MDFPATIERTRAFLGLRKTWFLGKLLAFWFIHVLSRANWTLYLSFPFQRPFQVTTKKKEKLGKVNFYIEEPAELDFHFIPSWIAFFVDKENPDSDFFSESLKSGP